MEEIWKQSSLAPEYEVSSLGRVRHKDAKRVRKPISSSNGYLYISIRDTSMKYGVKDLSIHRLVAQEFLPNPHNLPQVNHIDGNKGNNAVNNLEWCSVSHNIQHSSCVLGNYRKITDEIATEIKSKYVPYSKKGSGTCLYDLAQEYGLHIDTVHKLCKGKRIYSPKKVSREKLSREDMEYIINNYNPHNVRSLCEQKGVTIQSFYKWILPIMGLTVKELKEKYYQNKIKEFNTIRQQTGQKDNDSICRELGVSYSTLKKYM